jgi:hypothetical protein
MEIPVSKVSIILTEQKKERNDEADSYSHMYDNIGFSVNPDRLLQNRDSKPKRGIRNNQK